MEGPFANLPSYFSSFIPFNMSKQLAGAPCGESSSSTSSEIEMKDEPREGCFQSLRRRCDALFEIDSALAMSELMFVSMRFKDFALCIGVWSGTGGSFYSPT